MARKKGKKLTPGPEVVKRENRIISAIPRLDYILKGGFFRGSTYCIYGPPGSGKTIFTNQFCFNQVRANAGRCVYVSILGESISKMLAHIEDLSFFEPRAIGEEIYYVSGYSVLKDDGFAGLLSMVHSALAQQQASVLVIDGLDSPARGTDHEAAFKEFLHELQGLTSILGCTSFLVMPTRHESEHPEHSICDGVLEFSRHLIGPRSVRELTVHKFRGSACLDGRHEIEITSEGVQIHPRTEVQFADPPESAKEERIRMSFGIKTLDAMIEGGIPSGSCGALLGAPGTGKTVLGLHFLIEGAKKGQRGIYFGFYEPPPRLCEKAEKLGLNLNHWVKKGLIELIWQPPLEHYVDALAEQLLEKRRRERDEGRTRLFIDGIEGFRNANIYPDRTPRFLSAFINQLRTLDSTCLISEELELFKSELDMPAPELANVVESIILLRYVELQSEVRRLISVMKMRESAYDTSIKEFKMSGKGIEILGSFAGVEAVLSGHARGASQGQDSSPGKGGGKR